VKNILLDVSTKLKRRYYFFLFFYSKKKKQKVPRFLMMNGECRMMNDE